MLQLWLQKHFLAGICTIKGWFSGCHPMPSALCLQLAQGHGLGYWILGPTNPRTCSPPLARSGTHWPTLGHCSKTNSCSGAEAWRLVEIGSCNCYPRRRWPKGTGRHFSPHQAALRRCPWFQGNHDAIDPRWSQDWKGTEGKPGKLA